MKANVKIIITAEIEVTDQAELDAAMSEIGGVAGRFFDDNIAFDDFDIVNWDFNTDYTKNMGEGVSLTRKVLTENDYKRAAQSAGWYINSRGNFEITFGTDVPDEVLVVSPTDPGAWGLLCEMEGIEVQ